MLIRKVAARNRQTRPDGKGIVRESVSAGSANGGEGGQDQREDCEAEMYKCILYKTGAL